MAQEFSKRGICFPVLQMTNLEQSDDMGQSMSGAAAVVRRRLGLGAAVALLALAIAFAGMSKAFLGMALGRAPDGQAVVRERPPAYWPALALLSISLGLGLWIPRGLGRVLEQAAWLLGGGGP